MPFTTKFSVILCLALVFASGQQALAVNDWSIPCTRGECSWELPAHSRASGTVHIHGSSDAISDITEATGWKIISSCDPASTAQKIQLVCKDDNPNCEHLFQGKGAADTIVRLPDSCGPMPFARVARHHVLQSNLSSRASAARVHELALDTNFSAITPSQGGIVHFSIQGIKGKANMKPPLLNLRGHPSMWPHASSRDNIHRRNVFAHGLNAPRSLGAFNKTLSLRPIDVDFSGVKSLLNTNSIGASTLNESVSLNVGADVRVSISLGIVATGTLIPPHITEFGLFCELDGIVDANLSVMANISGQVDSGSTTLFQIGVPGLSFPGLLELDPNFKLMGHIDAIFGNDNIDAVIDLNYKLSNASFIFPPQSNTGIDGITPGAKHGNVRISAGTGIGATFDATGHLMPQVDIGLKALGGIVSTAVFLNLDASAEFSLSNGTASAQKCVEANTNLNVSVGARGSFFSLFKASVGASLFDKDFQLPQKCFAAGKPSSMGY